MDNVASINDLDRVKITAKLQDIMAEMDMIPRAKRLPLLVYEDLIHLSYVNDCRMSDEHFKAVEEQFDYLMSILEEYRSAK